MNQTSPGGRAGFDAAAAITRSLLGWGVLAGIFYLVTGIVLGVTRTGFDFGKHALSQLMLGDLGWTQTVNLILSGLMTLAASIGFQRAMRGSRHATAASLLVGVFGACLIGSAIFAPDPVGGFPEGATSTDATLSGVLHLAFGAVGFLSLAAAAFVVSAWFNSRGESQHALYSRVGGVLVALGFVVGAAFSSGLAGIVALWIAVVAGWGWLAMTSVTLYRTVPHPDAHRRDGSTSSTTGE